MNSEKTVVLVALLIKLRKKVMCCKSCNWTDLSSFTMQWVYSWKVRPSIFISDSVFYQAAVENAEVLRLSSTWMSVLSLPYFMDKTFCMNRHTSTRNSNSGRVWKRKQNFTRHAVPPTQKQCVHCKPVCAAPIQDHPLTDVRN